MASFIIPVIVLVIVVYGFIKKVEIYDVFLVGVKEGLSLAVKIFPTIFAMVIGINVLLKSNIINDAINFIGPVLDFIRFPRELVPLAIMRPISGSSSLIIMNDIFASSGPDSFVGRVASIIQGSSDTTIYIISLYFASVGIKKIRYSLIVGLLSDFLAVILSIIMVNIFF